MIILVKISCTTVTKINTNFDKNLNILLATSTSSSKIKVVGHLTMRRSPALIAAPSLIDETFAPGGLP